MFIKKYLIVVIALLTITLIFLRKEMTPIRPLNIGISGEWKSIVPGLQHSLFADLVLVNQFDPLVGTDIDNRIIPLGAKSWKVSDDLKTYEFEIDTDRTFSDGSKLSAKDYKSSWEEALKLSPMSANNSLQDVLYAVDGFQTFGKTGALSGLEAPTDSRLTIRFIKPFRMALDHLTGSRYAAWKKAPGGAYLGTGEFVIQELSEHRLRLEPNPFSSLFSQLKPMTISYVKKEDIISSFKEQRLDVLGYSMGAYLDSDVVSNQELTVIPGEESLHIAVGLNGLKGHILEDPKLRRAVQTILVNAASVRPGLLARRDAVEPDSQFFLPLQAGRLPLAEVANLVKEGETEIPRLVEISKKRPLKVLVAGNWKWIIEAFEQQGVVLTEDSGIVLPEQIYELAYKRTDYDIFTDSFSVVGGDPDGIYHALGPHGAIVAPVTQRKRVGDLLERNRSITRIEELDAAYQEVSRAILEEVPYVHLGFSRSVVVIDPSRVEVMTGIPRRNQGHFHIFRHK